MRKKLWNKVLITTVLSISLVASLGVTGCGKSNTSTSGNASSSDAESENQDGYVVKLGISQGALCHAPLQAAIENGYFEEEGLKIKKVDIGGAVIQEALASGQIDAGFGLIAKFIQPLENGLPLKITSGMHTGCTKLLVKKDSDIHTVADLKGKTIAVPSLADSAAITTKRSLSRVGIGVTSDNLEVNLVAYNITDMAVALNNGAIDAFCVHDPVATTAEKEYDLREIINTTTDEDYKDEYCCISFVSTKLAEKHPKEAAAFTRAVMKGSAWVEEHAKETAKLQIEHNYVSGDEALNAEIIDSYYYNPSVSGAYDALVAVTNELSEIGLLKKDTDVDKFIENAFVKLEDVPDKIVYENDQFVETD